MTATDAQLLADFANRRDEPAFRELTRRHLGLVFHTALRSTGNRALSEEIAQNVLCAVAAKAGSLARHPERFAAWLHRAAVYESSKAMRKEASHQRRSRLQHPDAVPATAEEGDGRWQAVLPLLDTALDALPESDRRVVVLHFFERQQFAQIGALLGKTPAAVQKQSVRALEKLARLLKGRGVAIPIGLLATGIAIESAKSAPVALLASVTSAGVATKVGTSQGILLTMSSHPKLSASCGLLLLALPLVLQQLAIARAEAELAGLRSGSPGGVTAQAIARSRPQAGFVDELDLVKLADEAARATRSQMLRISLRRKLGALEPAVLADLMKRLHQAEVPKEKRDQLAAMLGLALGRKDPALALKELNTDEENPDTSFLLGFWAPVIYRRWLEQDCPAARAWLEDLQRRPFYAGELEKFLNSGPVISGNYWVNDGEKLTSFRALLTLKLMTGDSDAGNRYLESLPSDNLRAITLERALK
ncbi:MAG: sigE 1, partial [Akkermansiaceae bacterium]|nr:sigE 1 [Akkermansiaceae bacterium]